MKKPQRLVRIPVLDTQPGSEDADGIGRNRNRNAGQGKESPPEEGFFKEIPVKNGEGKQGDQRTNAAASLRHLEFHGGELNDVALAQNRDAEQRQEIAGKFGGEDLERKGYLIENNGGKGNGEEEDEEGKAEFLEELPSQERQDQASQQDHERNPGQKDCRAIGAEKQDDECQRDHGNSRPSWRNLFLKKSFSLVPDEVGGKNRDQEAVGVIGVPRPDDYQAGQHAGVDEHHQGANDDRAPCKLSISKVQGAGGSGRHLGAVGHTLRKTGLG